MGLFGVFWGRGVIVFFVLVLLFLLKFSFFSVRGKFFSHLIFFVQDFKKNLLFCDLLPIVLIEIVVLLQGKVL